MEVVVVGLVCPSLFAIVCTSIFCDISKLAFVCLLWRALHKRHTVAMGLVDSGVDLIYIRDLLGHVSVKTTEIYGKADVRKKREAIEAASKKNVPITVAEWDNNSDLKQWLKTFNQK
ncbi:MAG: tyrosine-type recombinase/integrase [Verrucomicrobia bacterium]|nr:tyrosine-type recombinase/integrase [Prolixibacteraceae bacterium]